jgi:hypothetical protein
MANSLPQFLTDRFIKPQVDAQVSAILKSTTRPLAYGISSIPGIFFKDAVAQPPDSDYNLLYAIYRVNAHMATCIKLI